MAEGTLVTWGRPNFLCFGELALELPWCVLPTVPKPEVIYVVSSQVCIHPSRTFVYMGLK